MPLIPSQDFNRAKKRMQLGLHPAVLAAVERAVQQPRSQVISNTLQPGVAAGTGVNQGGPLRSAARAGKTYQTFLKQGPGGKVQEIHDYGGDLGSVTFDRKPTAQIQSLLAQSPAQHMSNTATAEDKLLAMAVRQAATGGLAGGLGVRRKFSRAPGPMIRY